MHDIQNKTVRYSLNTGAHTAVHVGRGRAGENPDVELALHGPSGQAAAPAAQILRHAYFSSPTGSAHTQACHPTSSQASVRLCRAYQ